MQKTYKYISGVVSGLGPRGLGLGYPPSPGVGGISRPRSTWNRSAKLGPRSELVSAHIPRPPAISPVYGGINLVPRWEGISPVYGGIETFAVSYPTVDIESCAPLCYTLG